MKQHRALAGLVLVLLAAQAAAADPSVEGDDATDSYRGIGGVVLSQTWTGTPTQRRTAATCAGCRWSFHSSCRVNGMGCGSGSWAPCPPGTARFDMRRSDSADGPMTYRGSVCLGPRGPVSTREVTTSVRGETIRTLPPLSPHLRVRAAVRGVSTPVTVGVPTSQIWDMDVLEHRVRIHARATVRWQWSASATTQTSSADVLHTWTHDGFALVPVSVQWTAHFSIDGIGSLPVEQTVNQTGSLHVRVSPARAVLLTPGVE